jgi:hypothetical protein
MQPFRKTLRPGLITPGLERVMFVNNTTYLYHCKKYLLPLKTEKILMFLKTKSDYPIRFRFWGELARETASRAHVGKGAGEARKSPRGNGGGRINSYGLSY